MNWFNNKPKEEVLDPMWCCMLRDFPVGREFTYLTRKLIVVAHVKEYDNWSNTLKAIHIDCEYCDNNGVLQEWRFHSGMATVLAKVSQGYA